MVDSVSKKQCAIIIKTIYINMTGTVYSLYTTFIEFLDSDALRIYHKVCQHIKIWQQKRRHNKCI